jgi:hypothetical protein
VSIPALTVPTFIAVPVGTPPPLPKVVAPNGVIAPYSALPAPGTPAATTSAPAHATPAPANSLGLGSIRPASSSGSSGGGTAGTGGGQGAGPTALIGVALAAAFIGTVELRDRRRPA